MSNELESVLAAVIGLLLGLVGILAWFLFRRRPRTNAADFQVQADPTIPVVPTIPPAPVAVQPRRITMNRGWIGGLLALLLLLFIVWLFTSGRLRFSPLATTPGSFATTASSAATLNGGCKGAWSSTRELVVSSDVPCWGKLLDGDPADITANTTLFVTYWRGGDVYLQTLQAGQTLKDLIAATVRPALAGWTKRTILSMERKYHAENGANPSCIRDLDTNDILTTLCE